MVAFNKDCGKIAVANEGEGVYDATGLVDPEGSVSIISIDNDGPQSMCERAPSGVIQYAICHTVPQGVIKQFEAFFEVFTPLNQSLDIRVGQRTSLEYR